MGVACEAYGSATEYTLRTYEMENQSSNAKSVAEKTSLINDE